MSSELFNRNKQCCSVPAVIVEEGTYVQRGTFRPFGGYEKVYFTGPNGTGKAIVVAYDGFGFSPQGLQGADILANTVNALVVVPDVFKGDTVQHSWMDGSEASQKRLQAWWGSTGNFVKRVGEVQEFVDALHMKGSVKIGLLGYCWGGELVTRLGSDATNFAGIASVHPTSPDAKQAESLAVPIAFFPSQGESKADCDAFWNALKAKPFFDKCRYRYYGNVIHGFAAARADLKDPLVKAEYKDVYQRLGTFFNTVFDN